ncbi:uncharacterized protein PHACADRAFT_201781 [Phanerochaete carnosa HHB-10118-sp]|uniref:Uncharacterized protein n=1 Tax=Phanerochaete carnosa (strain HHB-10118-sp) TaxID=650164 RepID=K5WGN9_PHACS|nr:uncharacterized protein PHACADRAFT_201781 [Phanerochaete carnosa HHB-10118-sp]EKM49337.1 hypothetical protein PHACADRAFT_201781 [Phanerochaete carnosa HHB-10118-sp]
MTSTLSAVVQEPTTTDDCFSFLVHWFDAWRWSKDEDEMNAFIVCAVRWLSRCDVTTAPLEIIDIIIDSISRVSNAIERRNIHDSGDCEDEE